MTTHQLARILLEMEDKPAMSFGDEGYFEIGSIIPATIYESNSLGVKYNVPATLEQKKRAFQVWLVT